MFQVCLEPARAWCEALLSSCQVQLSLHLTWPKVNVIKKTFKESNEFSFFSYIAVGSSLRTLKNSFSVCLYLRKESYLSQ